MMCIVGIMHFEGNYHDYTKMDTAMRIYNSLVDKILNFIHGRIRYTGKDDAIRFIEANFPCCQYTGAAPFDNIIMWCEAAFRNDYVWNFETFYFKYEKDEVLFRLKWIT